MNDSLDEMYRIIDAARPDGWVLEPEAKRLFRLAGFDVPRFMLARTPEEAVHFAHEIGYPVVAKVVSPRILHKTDVGGVAVGIADAGRLEEVFRRFQGKEGFVGMIVEEIVSGVELILGAKIDLQFGPMILLGMGGTGVEIYQDVALRMAPLSGKDVHAMIAGLKARRLLEKKGLAYKYIGHGSYLRGWRRRNALKMWTGWPTFPMVFVKGVLVGGASELEKLIASGEIRRMLASG